MKLEFFGRRILILGGTCELAFCLADCLIRDGLFPILTWRTEEGRQRITRALASFGGQYETAYCDLGNRDSVETLFSRIGEDIDYLVDFAQGDFESLIGSANPDTIHAYFAENISARAELLRAAGRIMLRKKRGRLIHISSAAVGRANPGQGFYAAAKLASEALYRNLGIELGSRGITAMILRPGYIDAGRGEKYLRAHPEAVAKNGIGRALTCHEVAEAVVYFLSDGACAFNAVAIPMDGGLSAAK